MEISFVQIEDVTKGVILEDMNYVNESLLELKRGIVALDDTDFNNDIYHRFCDTEDEIKNILEEIKFILKG